MKKVIIAGGRDFGKRKLPDGTYDVDWYHKCQEEMNGVLWELFCGGHQSLPARKDLLVVSGMADGADKLGIKWAQVQRYVVAEHPADWNQHGRAAGVIRNREMAKMADILVAFWDGKSRGTKNMILTAMEEGLEIHVYRYEEAE